VAPEGAAGSRRERISDVEVLQLGRVLRLQLVMGCLSVVSRGGWRRVISRRSVMGFYEKRFR